jgi:hypothetical protein
LRKKRKNQNQGKGKGAEERKPKRGQRDWTHGAKMKREKEKRVKSQDKSKEQ